MNDADPEQPSQYPRVVVVGPCASGKSTLVASLKTVGYDVFACAQEHSVIRALWNHRNPDLVIVLDVDLATVRTRRGDTWPSAIFDMQLERLRYAREAADLVIDAASLSEEQVLGVARRFLDCVRDEANSG